MKMLKIFNKFKVNQKQQNIKTPYNIQPQPLALQPLVLNFNYTHFNSEKNIKSLGMPLSYDIDYYGMANRA